ncbi:MAG: efflux RND transporter permease subunit, partial [Armatimonadetes bacterium]|nr:efflux RND transporter permease subunit [Armatimonadota bacterium]
EEVVKPRLSQVPGLGGVTVVGGRRREIQVRVDPDRLAQYGLSLTDLIRPLGASSRSAPAGSLVQGSRDVAVRVLGEFRSLQDLENTPVPAPTLPGSALRTGPGGAAPAVLRLRDMATIRDTETEPDQITRVGRRESLGLVLTRVTDANSVEVAEGVRRALAELKERIPRDAEISILQDHSRTVADALEDINATLILGSLLAVLVVFLFLHSLKDTLIVACAIPTSLVVTFIVMYFAGFTLNQMTMLALSLSVGILVDDSILVLECIHRHRARGKEAQQAALDGRQEIGLADAANTFVDVVVFVPIAFMAGIVGQFFRQFGLTIATATLASLYISFTLTPMLAARLLRPGEGLSDRYGPFARWFEARYAALEERYRQLLRRALRRRAAVVLLGFGSLLGVGLLAFQQLGFDFTPSIDRGQVTVEVELPPGTALPVTSRAMELVEAEAEKIPEVDRMRMLASVGEILGGFGSLPDRGPQLGQLTLMLIEKQGFLDRLLHPRGQQGLRSRSDEEVATALRERLADPNAPTALRSALAGASVTVAAARGLTAARAPIEIDLYGRDLDDLERVSAEAVQRLARVPFLRNVD